MCQPFDHPSGAAKMAPENRIVKYVWKQFNQDAFHVLICLPFHFIASNGQRDLRDEPFFKVLRRTVLAAGTVEFLKIGLPNCLRESLDNQVQHATQTHAGARDGDDVAICRLWQAVLHPADEVGLS